MGQHRPGYNRYESGRIKPTPQTLLKMAQVLDVDVDELLRPGPPDITLLRARRGLTQAQVAAALGRSHVWYRRVERRQTAIPPDLLARLAELLTVDRQQLAALLTVRPTG